MIKSIIKISSVATALIIMLCSTLTVSAECYDKLVDGADIFTELEETAIENELNKLTKETGWDCIIHTNTNDIESYDMEDYCNDYYTDNNYGIGADYDGVFLTIDMASREMYVITQGMDAMYHFNDERMDDMLDSIQACLAEGSYYSAANTFTNYIKKYHSMGKPSGGTFSNVELAEDTAAKRENPILYVITHFGIFILLIAAIVCTISVIFIKHRYKNNGTENIYNLKENHNMYLTTINDVFIDKHVSVHVVSSSSSSGGRSGGGGGGGGRSHGGGGRSF